MKTTGGLVRDLELKGLSRIPKLTGRELLERLDQVSITSLRMVLVETGDLFVGTVPCLEYVGVSYLLVVDAKCW